jgi:hypothetical protein
MEVDLSKNGLSQNGLSQNGLKWKCWKIEIKIQTTRLNDIGTG